MITTSVETNLQDFLNSTNELNNAMLRAVETSESAHIKINLDQASESLKDINNRLLCFTPTGGEYEPGKSRKNKDGVYDYVPATIAPVIDYGIQIPSEHRPEELKNALRCIMIFFYILNDALNLGIQLLQGEHKKLKTSNEALYKETLSLLKDNINHTCQITKEFLDQTNQKTKAILLELIKATPTVSTLRECLFKSFQDLKRFKQFKDFQDWENMGRLAEKIGLPVR